jgi:hypothetical protein
MVIYEKRDVVLTMWHVTRPLIGLSLVTLPADVGWSQKFHWYAKADKNARLERRG